MRVSDIIKKVDTIPNKDEVYRERTPEDAQKPPVAGRPERSRAKKNQSYT